jgi:CrcB protein
MLKTLILLAGGALGTLARYALSGYVQSRSEQLFPWGTLSVNLVGCLVIGIMWGIFEESDIPPTLRTFIFIGLLGGFTTFSSFALETLNLLRDGQWKMALLSVLLNNVGGLVLAFAGLVLSRYIIDLIK